MAATNERVILKRGKSDTIPQAKEAGSILIETDTGVAYVDNTSTQRVQLKDPTKLPLEGGTMTGDIDMGDNNITTSHEPENDDDVVTKKYVDSNMREYTGVDPIIVNENRIMHSSIGEQSGGPTANTTVDYGESFNVPNIQTNNFGHTTNITNRKITLPSVPSSVSHAESADTATKADTATNADNASSADTAKQADEASKLSESQTIDGVSFDGTKAITHYGICSTAAGTVAKTVSCNDFVLDTGADIEVQFENTNTATAPTLNVNDTGAKSIQYNGSSLSSSNANYLLANHIYRFVYDGLNYNIVGDINTDTDTNTTYTATSPILISSDNDISHLEYDAQSGGPDSDATLKAGGTFQVPYVSSDSTGHVSLIMNRTFTLPTDSGSGGGGATYTAQYPIEISDDVISHAETDCGDVHIGPEDDQTLDYGDTFTVPRFETDTSGHVVVGKDITFTMPSGSGGGGGESDTADRLTTPRNIDGVAFDGSEDIVHYGVCETDADVAQKIVDLEGFSIDNEGAVIHVKFKNTNTAEYPTLNINDTGAKAITSQGEGISTNVLVKDTIYTFIYQGGTFDLVSGILNRVDTVEDDQAVFRNIVVAESDENPNELDVPVGSIIMKKVPSGISNTYYGTSSTASGTATKIVVCEGFELKDGSLIAIYFTNENTASSPKLNVDGTGALNIYSQGEQVTSETIKAKTTYLFVYHDGYYEIVGSASDDLTDAINDIYDKLSITLSMDSTYYDTGGVNIEDLQTEMTRVVETVDTLQNRLDEVVNLMYPIGSIYISVNSTSPATLFGGTWEQIEDTFLLASGSAYGLNTTGGEATVTLTSSQMPSHTHSLPSHTHSTPSHTHSIPALSGTAASAGSHTHTITAIPNQGASGSDLYIVDDSSKATTTSSPINSAGAHTHSVTTTSSTTGSSSGTSGSTSGTSDSTGSGSSHNNMPPYLAVNVWKRTA